MRRLIILFFLFAPTALISQSSVSVGWLPEISVSHKWNDQWRITGQVESMQVGFTKRGSESFKTNYDYVRTDLTMVLSYRTNPSVSIAAGGMTRFVNGQLVYRSLQQISYAQRGRTVRFGHRFRTDQTFSNKRSMQLRLRYRFSGELPLQGQSLNEGEWYLISSAEQIASVERSKWEWEQRLSSAFGYYFNAKNKVEIGLDYRLDDFTQGDGRHRIWTMINYFLNL